MPATQPRPTKALAQDWLKARGSTRVFDRPDVPAWVDAQTAADYIDWEPALEVGQREPQLMISIVASKALEKNSWEYSLKPFELSADPHRCSIDYTNFVSDELGIAIAESHAIVGMQTESDDDEQDVPVSEETWQRTVTFLYHCARQVFLASHRKVRTPKIHAGPEGSIDIYWDLPAFRAALNIPPSSGEAIDFFFEDKNISNMTKGTTDDKSLNAGLVAWMAEIS